MGESGLYLVAVRGPSWTFVRPLIVVRLSFVHQDGEDRSVSEHAKFSDDHVGR